MPGPRHQREAAVRCYADDRKPIIDPCSGHPAGDQSQDRQSTGSNPSAIDPRACRRGCRVNRRELMLLLGGAMTAARTLRAQQKAMPVIGILGPTSPGPFAGFVAAYH